MVLPTPDPIGLFVGLAPAAAAQLKDFRARNEVRALFGLLKKELAGRPGFPWEQVRRLAIDPSIQGFMLGLLDAGRVDEDALCRRLIDLCDPGDYADSREAFADEVATVILDGAHRAVRDDRQAIRNIIRAETDQLRELLAATQRGPDPLSALRRPYLRLPAGARESKGPPSLPLRAEYGVVPFRGREEELAWIGNWCAEDDASVAVLIAGPGAGKTRLAAEAGRVLHTECGWVAGMLKPRPSDDLVRALAGLDMPQLVVIDDAPSRGSEIAALLIALDAAARSAPARLLLLARDDGEWRQNDLPKLLRGTGTPEIVLASAKVRPLSSVEPHTGGREEAFHQASAAFAETFRSEAPRDALPDLSQDLFGDILCVHLAALTAVAGDARLLDGRIVTDDLLADLVAREADYWETCPRSPGIPIHDAAVRKRAVALATLTCADDEEEAAAALRTIPDLADASEHDRRAIARWLKSLYPAPLRPDANDGPAEQWLRPLGPDLVGEYLVSTVLADVSSLASNLLASATPAQLDRALTVLTRSARVHEPAAAALLAALKAHLPKVWRAAVTVARQTGDPMGRLLAEALERTPYPEPALRLTLEVPFDTVALRLPAVVSAEHAFTYFTRAPASGARDAALAEAAGNLAMRQAAVGRREDALISARRSVDMYRSLAQRQPERFLGYLGLAVNGESIRLIELGHREEALASSQEAVAISRQLAATDPDAFLPGLAAGLNNRAGQLRALGRREEALASSQEAVAISRQLAATDPDGSLPGLANALNNASVQLSALGRQDQALAAIQEAAVIDRRQAKADPDRFLPAFSLTLNNLSNHLAAAGRLEEAFGVIEEAVAIDRHLAEAHPAAFLPVLAGTLNNECIHLARLGRYDAALAGIREAVAVLRDLAREHPAAFRPGLAQALNNKSNVLVNLGDHAAALISIQEAVAIRRDLAREHPAAFRPDLAQALTNEANALARLEDHQAALTSAQEAVAILRALARERPGVFDAELASALAIQKRCMRS